jgi:hypothetical protein
MLGALQIPTAEIVPVAGSEGLYALASEHNLVVGYQPPRVHI